MPPKLHKYQFPIFTLEAMLLEMAPRGTLSHKSFLMLMLNPHTVLQVSNIIRQITLKCGTRFQGLNAVPYYADCLQKKKKSKIFGENVGPCTTQINILCENITKDSINLTPHHLDVIFFPALRLTCL